MQLAIMRKSYSQHNNSVRGPGSSVCIVTDYGLDGPEKNPGALGPTQSPVKWVQGLSGGYGAAGACC